jgi:lipopolysaccharide/colanic/teichoic acid biosynthesis glycosyltransferase
MFEQHEEKCPSPAPGAYLTPLAINPVMPHSECPTVDGAGAVANPRQNRFLKRSCDLVIAGVLLLALSPIFAALWLYIWMHGGRPVLLRQARVAQNSGEFVLLKFRTMVPDADAILAQWEREDSPFWREYSENNCKLHSDPRVIPALCWIRKWSLDELPQFLNVLRGDMSIVGPRPLLARELPRYGAAIASYRQLKPGITGLWQVSGRNHTSFDHRVSYDVEYARKGSFFNDLAILVRTLKVVVTRHGAH